MTSFAYPNVGNPIPDSDDERPFLGCGRFYINESECPEGEQNEAANITPGHVGNVKSAATVLAPQCLSTLKPVYEKRDNKLKSSLRDPEGYSLEFAYLLALINRMQPLNPEVICENKDIWCTGRIEFIIDKPRLMGVTTSPFLVKLKGFLDDKNTDPLFLVAAENFDFEENALCKKKNVVVTYLADMKRHCDASPCTKRIILVHSHELPDLVNYLFLPPPTTLKKKFLPKHVGWAGAACTALVLVAILFFTEGSFLKNSKPVYGKTMQQLSLEIQSVLQLAYNAKIPSNAVEASVSFLVQSGLNAVPGKSTHHDVSWRNIQNGEHLTSLDNYRILVYPRTSAFFYVFQIDSHGKLDWLFPDNASTSFSWGKNPVQTNNWLYLPPDGMAYHLDENTGVEHLYVVATASQWIELEKALVSAAESRAKPVKMKKSLNLQTRGNAGPRIIPQENNDAGDLKNMIRLFSSREGVLVFEKSFFHDTP